MLGQMIMAGFRGDGDKFNEDIPYIRDLVKSGKAGGIILFENEAHSLLPTRNISSPAQLRQLCAQLQSLAPTPLFIAVDQEGGRVQRLKASRGFQDWPSPIQMSQFDDAAVTLIGRQMGQELASVGINLNFAPLLDVNVNPASPAIGAAGRSFGAAPAVVTAKAAAFLAGLNSAGVIGCFKHFPGHGSAAKDTHNGTVDVTNTWKELELAPYRALLGKPGAYAVMAAHVFNRALDPDYPASLSAGTIGGLLRNSLGWKGVVFGDDMHMNAIAEHYSLSEALLLGVNAGLDVFIFGNNMNYDKTIAERAYNTLLQLHKNGKITKERIRESYNRIMILKTHLTSSPA